MEILSLFPHPPLVLKIVWVFFSSDEQKILYFGSWDFHWLLGLHDYLNRNRDSAKAVNLVQILSGKHRFVITSKFPPYCKTVEDLTIFIDLMWLIITHVWNCFREWLFYIFNVLTVKLWGVNLGVKKQKKNENVTVFSILFNL